MGADQKTTFLLDGTIDDRTEAEYASPVVQTGSSPTLVRSVNTRLSVARGTCVRSPGYTSILSAGADVRCGGVVPAKAGQSAVAFFTRRAGANRQLYQRGSTHTANTVYPPQTFDAWYRPIQITGAGALAFGPSISHVASAYDASRDVLWYATFQQEKHSAFQALMVYATDASGAAYCSPKMIDHKISGDQIWLGLTQHGADGAAVWFLDGVGLRVALVNLSANTIVTTLAVTTVYTPAVTDSGFDVVRIDDTFAALVGPDAVTGADGRIMVVTVASGAIAATVTRSAAMNGNGSQAAVAAQTVAGVSYVVAAFSSVTSNTTTTQLYTSGALTPVWGGVHTIADYGPVTVGFLVGAQQPAVVVAQSHYFGTSFQSVGNSTYTDVRAISVSAGAETGAYKVPWRMLGARAEQVTQGSTDSSPALFLVPCYGDDAPKLSIDYVDEPALEVHLVVDRDFVRPIRMGSVGVVRGTVSAARVLYDQYLMRTATVLGAGKVLTTYRKDDLSAQTSADGYAGRYVVLDFGAFQPRVAHDRDGCALAAAALPFFWDGVHITPMGHAIGAPKLNADLTGGTGDLLAAGVYSFIAMYRWTDAAGLSHKSRVSNTVTLTTTGAEQPILYVTNPLGEQAWTIEVYMTEVNGAEYHLITDASDTGLSSDYYDVYADISTPDAQNGQVYSLTGAGGEELFPQPPPPLHDVTVVGSRAWAIDGEIRSRGVPSKLRIAGTGFEWAPALEVNFPSGAGDLMAVREWQGIPVFLAERAVFQVTGDGPNNTGAGNGFSAPTKISDFGCTNAASVLYTPAGIVWQYNDWLMVLNAQGVQQIPNIRANELIAGVALMRNQDEVVFYSGESATKWVYNYARGRWTTWDAGTLATPVSNVAALPWTTQASYVYAQTSGALSVCAHDSVSAAPSMVWEVDWVLLGGDFQDPIVLRWVVFNGRRVGAHDLKIELFVNYNEAVAVPSVTWTAAQLAQVVDAQGRYTVKLEPTEQSTRAFKLRITETRVAGAGLRPGAVTVVWTMEDELVREETFAVSEVTIR